jgi:hypothetical protein
MIPVSVYIVTRPNETRKSCILSHSIMTALPRVKVKAKFSYYGFSLEGFCCSGGGIMIFLLIIMYAPFVTVYAPVHEERVRMIKRFVRFQKPASLAQCNDLPANVIENKTSETDL